MTSENIECVSVPYFIEQQIIPNPDGWIFETKISALVEESDEMYRSNVLPYLDLFCTTVLSQETAEDESMMFGSATTTRYRMHKTCPGSDVPHRCVQNN